MLSMFFFYGAVGLLALRLGVAAVLITHGSRKARNLPGTGAWFQGIGFRPGNIWGPLAAFLEVGGGILLVLGLFTQMLAILLAAEFVVIIFWRLKTRQPFVGGWELDLLMLAALLTLIFLGAGNYALDRSFILG